MIVCSECESPQYLNITKSRLYYDGDSEDLTEVDEWFECLHCGSTGKYEYREEDGVGQTTISGDIEESDDQPQMFP